LSRSSVNESPLALVERLGVSLESGKGPVPSLAALIAGETIRGNWWGHPKGREIFVATRAIRDSRDVLVCRLIDGKVTFVHRRLWPALVRLAPRLDPAGLAWIHEKHTASGAHKMTSKPYPKWVPQTVSKQAAKLTREQAIHQLGPWVTDCLRPS
jgi:hypothetical protein